MNEEKAKLDGVMIGIDMLFPVFMGGLGMGFVLGFIWGFLL